MCLVLSIYYSQKESTPFGYEGISTHFGYGVIKIFEYSNIHKIYKDLEPRFSLLNCFKYFLIYILRQNATKIRQEKF